MNSNQLTLRDQLAISALPACIAWQRHCGRDALIGAAMMAARTKPTD